MANVTGHFSLGSGQVMAFCFNTPTAKGILPVVGVMPTSPNFNNPDEMFQYESLDELGYPNASALSVSNVWTWLSPDGSTLFYMFSIMNFNSETVEFSILSSVL